ncbi:hypothetical protein PENSPDRAFT_739228 [Peniophora sp. CONT]|nr:hypothetical protein PENSPDRAFT_739228 [Peniophora sp. CONT]
MTLDALKYSLSVLETGLSRILEKHARTLVSLTIAGASEHTFANVQALAKHRYPALNLLSIESELESGDNAGLTGLPDNFLAGNTPQLRHFSATNIDFDWASIRGLLSLRVQTANNYYLRPRHIIGALERCPDIEELTLALSPMDRLGARIFDYRRILLQHIRKLFLSGAADKCMNLLGWLELPPKTSIGFSFMFDGSPDEMPTIAVNNAILLQLNRIAFQDRIPTLLTIGLVEVGSPQPDEPVRLRVYGLTSHPTFRGEQLHTNDLSDNAHIDMSILCQNRVDAEVMLQSTMRTWLRVKQAFTLDMRLSESLSPELWNVILEMDPAPTVIVKPEYQSSATLLELLYLRLRAQLKVPDMQRPITHIIIDASKSTRNVLQEMVNVAGELQLPPPTLRQWNLECNVMGILDYCAEAAHAGLPLDTIEIINDYHGQLRNLDGSIDWSELYQNLAKGFVYEGVLHNASTGQERRRLTATESILVR